MISWAAVAAGVAGLGASLVARRAAIYFQHAVGQPNLLPEIVTDLRKLVAGRDTKEFLTEYLQLLRRLGQWAARQLAMLAITLVTVTAVYAVTCWPLDSSVVTPIFNPLWRWLSDVEFSFLVGALIGSVSGPFILRSPV